MLCEHRCPDRLASRSNGAQPPLPAFPVRAACQHLADDGLTDDPPALLRALRSAIGVFYNHTQDLPCFSFKQGPNPETGAMAAGAENLRG